MQNDEITGGKSYIKMLKSLERDIKKNEGLQENRLFEREIQELIKTAGLWHFASRDGMPLLGTEIARLDKINDESVESRVALSSETRYVGEEDISSLLWQSKLCVIEAAVKNPGETEVCTKKLYDLRDLDIDELQKLSPVHSAFTYDEIYNRSSPETKAMYRSKAALIARCIGFDEEKYTRELIKRAVLNDKHLGEIIETDYRNVFPYVKSARYTVWLFILTLLVSLAVGLFTRLWVTPVVFLPVFAIIKPIMDIITSRFIRSGVLPRIEINDSLPEEGKTLCVISALAGDEEGVKEALERLKTAKLKNPQRGISFALLCDLKAADSETLPDDKELFKSSDKLRESIFPDSVIIFRRRSYSNTMRKWQGHERKRGAIEELLRFMCGEEISFAFASGNAEEIRDCEFVCALDLDTVPMMDSIKELAAIALHPLNERFGIIAPRCTSTIDSTLKTPFARAMAGNGGVSGISSYDSVSGEFYFDGFGEGIFCGKGLLRKRRFLEDCGGRLPNEWVLSHDILEGGLTGVAYAGDVEFSDSFPASSKAYFKRAHRWIRGDFQNLRFVFRKDFSYLTRFKLFDNFRRGINPLLILILFFLSCFVRNGYVTAICGYLALLTPFIPSLAASVSKGFAFGITRRFYSPIVSESAQLLIKAVLELMTLGKSALTSLDAGVKALWRCLVSKRNLLQWTTSGFTEKRAFKGGCLHLVPSFIAGLALLVAAVLGSPSVIPEGVLMCAAFPVLAYSDRPCRKKHAELSLSAKNELFEQVKLMWRFYLDYVNEENNFLPPDNVQFYPVYRVCSRTSPTNIGMYLLSAAAVYELGIISGEKLVKAVENSVENVEKLEKWHGNLFNWYDIKTLKPVSPFVSSVDSGNFIACLIAVKECLKLHELSTELVLKCERIIEDTRLSEFYCKKRRLFSIGYDTKEEKLSSHRYDMLMSEARLMSYVAIAKGEAPKSHWRALSRTMSRSGSYAGAIAWTGTMFEFYMPELLLTSKEGSMSYEALRYAFHCQKTRHCPFGISESGYYAFDKELNYQYKAHGVQKTALKAGMNKECVVSPYSSYLTMSAYPLESWNNLRVLEAGGAFNPDYGFYEAVDYTGERVGAGGRAVVRSFMAHHMGMSIAGAANALKDNICSRLFLMDEEMKRGEELLEEKVMAGEKVLKITDYRYDGERNPADTEEIREHTVFGSPVNTLCGGELALFTSANGLFSGCYKGLGTVNRTLDYLNDPSGAFYGFCDEKNIYPFFYHPMLSGKNLTAVFSTGETEYITREKELELSMKVRAYGDAGISAEIRTFSFKNKSKSRKQLTLCAYSEPTLVSDKDYKAHPIFMDLFLKMDYDRENKLFVFYRKERHGDRVTACAAGFAEDMDLSFCLSRESCTGYMPFSFFKKALIRESIDKSVPDPCLFIKSDITVDSGETAECNLFYCYGDSVKEAVEAALKIRSSGAEGTEPSPLSLNTLHGRMASKVLPRLLYGDAMEAKEIAEAKKENRLNRRALWRYGISGDNPIIAAQTSKGDNLSSLVLMKQGLQRCGIECDLIVLCDNALEKRKAEEVLRGLGYAHIKNEIGEEMVKLILALSVSTEADESHSRKELTAIPVLPCAHEGEENGFTENGYVIGNEENIRCNVLSNANFGTLLSQNSLGFTWAMNSRENKITPWNNDTVRDCYGEALLIKSGGLYYDLIRGSRAEFTPSYCGYNGRLPYMDSRTEVKVYSEGDGKEISITLTNTTDLQQSFELVYRIIFVMGNGLELSMPIVYTDKGCLIAENPQNPYYKGKTVVYCNKKASYLLSPIAAAAGDFSKAEEEIKPVSCDMTAVIVPLKLPPKEKLRIRFILGYCNDEAASSTAAAEYVKGLEGGPCGLELPQRVSVNCPDETLNKLFNIWLPHQVVSCRLWARSGFFQNGGAFGFRDQLQDCLAAMHFDKTLALEHIMNCCSSQFPEGDVLHWWHELNGKRIGVRTRYSDDLLWLPYTACEYWASYGEEGFWEQQAEYCWGDPIPQDKQELFMEPETSGLKESLYLHCKKAMEKGFNKGARGLIRIGCGDWNDGYNNVGVKGEGESIWLSMFYVICGRRFAKAAREQSDGDYAVKLEKRIAELCASIEENGWDGDRYLRAYYDSGEKMGSEESGACKIDILPQAFSVLCGLPDTEKSREALDTAWDLLVDKKNGIIRLFTPAFTEERSSQRPGYVMSYPEGVRENGGQYTHGAVWYCLACFKAGQKERGLQLLNMLNPALKGESFGREPYFMTADIYTNPQCYGRGGWSMYTGAAAWYWRCIFEGLFGVRIRGGKLIVKPNLPPEYSGAKLAVLGSELTFVYAEGADGEEIEVEAGTNAEIIYC